MPNRKNRSNGARHHNGGARNSRRQTSSSRSQQQRARARAISGAPARVISTIQANPIPAALIGAGLTWLLLGQPMSALGETNLMRRGRRRLGELGETFGESFSDAAESSASFMRRGASSVRDGISSIGEYAHDSIDAVRRTARRGAESASDAISSAWEVHPLAVCAAVLAAGVTAGMLLPSTRREERVMGRASVAVARRVRSRGANLVEKGKRLASEAIDTAGREARRQGLTTRELGQKVKRVASRARDSMTTE